MSYRSKLNTTYLAVRGQLMGVAARMVPAKEVEDIVQESYVRLCLVENSCDLQHPRSYLFRTVRNLALDYLKRSEMRLSDQLVEDEDGLFEASDATFAEVASNEEFAVFCEAVRHLPVECRKSFVLKKVYGYSQREIARELGLAESTVEKHIAQGIKRCTHFISRQAEQGKDKRNHAVRALRPGGTQP